MQNCANRRYRWLMIVENFDKKSKNFWFFFFAYSVRSRRVRKPNGLIFKISSRYSRERTGQSWKNAIFKKPFFVIFRPIFRFFLHLKWEHAVILPRAPKISRKFIQKWRIFFSKNAKNGEKCNFVSLFRKQKITSKMFICSF